MIDGYDPPKMNDHLLVKIAVVIGNASMTTIDEGRGRTELDSHANRVSLESNVKYYPSLEEVLTLAHSQSLLEV